MAVLPGSDSHVLRAQVKPLQDGGRTGHLNTLAVIEKSVFERMVFANPQQSIVVRFAAGGSVGEVTSGQLAISRLAAWLSRLVLPADLSDPMSGFFIIQRKLFEDTVRRLSGQGFEILFVSAPREVRFAELPYRFRQRYRGESKLDAPIMLEYLTLLADKMIGKWVPIRFVVFVLVGLFGMLVHLATLAFAFKVAGVTFYYAQAIATLVAMTVNFNLNNELTYRDRRLWVPSWYAGSCRST